MEDDRISSVEDARNEEACGRRGGVGCGCKHDIRHLRGRIRRPGSDHYGACCEGQRLHTVVAVCGAAWLASTGVSIFVVVLGGSSVVIIFALGSESLSRLTGPLAPATTN